MNASPTAPAVDLCHRCKARPAAAPGDVDAADPTPRRLLELARDPNPAVAHAAGASIGYTRDVEGWKRLAAEQTDPERAEYFRKHAAVAAETAKTTAQVAQDAKAVSEL